MEKRGSQKEAAVGGPPGLVRVAEQQELARLSKGLAHPTRVKIISMLARSMPRRGIICSEIAAAFPHAQSTISQHLKVLNDTGWLEPVVEYPRIYYRLSDGIADRCLELVRSCAGGGEQVPRGR